MKLEDLVLTIKQAKYLQELGLDMSDAALCWVEGLNGNYFITNKDMSLHVEFIPTYTLQEVLGKLPKRIKDNETYYGLYIQCDNYEVCYNGYEYFFRENLLCAVYEMLCWVIKNGYLKIK